MTATTIDVEETLAKLTMSNKIKLLTGLGWWQTEPVPEAGVRSMRMSDGPNGVRGTRFFNGVPSSCFPSSTGLGSSFDDKLAHKVGQALGAESRAKGCHILLGPTVNTQRSPLGGRSFESFSEDPHLNGTIAAAYIQGLQSTGVAATIKHFVANDQEFQRFSISSEVSERALREIYLKPFQIAIKKANPWALMSAYNRVNGVHVSESKRFLNDILRKEWGYKGLVMSDWTGTYSTTGSIKAGLDLEMPGPSVMRGKALERALMSEKVLPGDIDACVRKVLELLQKAEQSGIPFDGPEESIDTPELRKLLRTAAADTIVLLKNEKNLLPLSTTNVKKIAVIGPNAKVATTSGGGSARLLSTYTVSPLQGITEIAENAGVDVRYTIGAAANKYLPTLDLYIQQTDAKAGALIEFWNKEPSSDFMSRDPVFPPKRIEPVWTTETRGTDCFLVDGVDASKVDIICWIRYSTVFVPDESGDWEVGLSLAGRGNLFIDGKLVIDLSTNPKQGESFFGIGTEDVKVLVKDLKAGQKYDLEIRIQTEEFINRGVPFTCWGGLRLGGSRVIDEDAAIQEAVTFAKDSDVVILVVGLNHDWESEGLDRENLNLPGATNRLISEVLQVNPSTIVVNQSGAPVLMPWIEEAHTLIQAFYGGNELGNGIADVLFGEVNPSGKLALTFPKKLEDTPSYPSFGNKGQEHGKILYNEGIFVGYRSYEIRSLPPLFPFGYGLSYTQFEYSNIEISDISREGRFTVSYDITNTGKVEGREVTQVYVADKESSLPRPIKELKGYSKVSLTPGTTVKAKVELGRDALGFYDDREGHWIAEKGKFTVFVASSSADIRLQGEVVLNETLTWVGL